MAISETFSKKNSSVTIIVPVYGDWSSLDECIESLKSNIGNDHKVLLVNDCGPDVNKIEDNILKSIDGHDHFHYRRNEKNLGFIGTCNRAVFELDKTNNDILLLNSDTKTTAGFLQEMSTVLYAKEENIGVVSPRTNNATIATIPLTAIKQHGIQKDKSYRLFKKINNKLPPYTIVPTAHGFCMLIRRQLINEAGLFDTDFGKGYGEEVDFCQRARAAGYKCALSNRAFVFHLEARSFSMESKKVLLEQNKKIINERYPNYKKEVDTYISEALKRELLTYGHKEKLKYQIKTIMKKI